MLGEDRGAALAVIVSRLNFIIDNTEIPVRLVGLSTTLLDPRDLADWLRVDQINVYNFLTSERSKPLEGHIEEFSARHYCPRIATMDKAVYQGVLQRIGRDNGKVVVMLHDLKNWLNEKFFCESFLVESSLPKVFTDHVNAEVLASRITGKKSAMTYVKSTFFFKRLLKNPKAAWPGTIAGYIIGKRDIP